MKIPFGAYFYPISIKSKERIRKAAKFGYKLINESEIVKKALPLYPGHAQPNVYCLGDSKTTYWDDTDIRAMDKQINLALEYNLNFFIFNTYIGTKSGKIIRELVEVLNCFVSLQSSKSIKFGLAFVLESPRAVLPVPRIADFEEPNRGYDINKQTARAVIDDCVKKYWCKKNYLYLKGKPYLSIHTSRLDSSITSPWSRSFKAFIEYLYVYSQKKYKLEPYVVGIIRKKEDGILMEHSGVRALTGYAFLPDFDKGASPIQNYDTLLQRREGEWKEIAYKSSIPFIPPAVIGWDGSPRGEQGFKLKEVERIYPYVPIIEGNTPLSFQQMLSDSLSHIKSNIPESERYCLICAWNEISEGCALLPRLKQNQVDFGYLEVLKEVAKTLDIG